MEEATAQAVAEALVETHWAQLAPQAWSCYQRLGRGALFGSVDEIVASVRASLATDTKAGNQSLVYVTGGLPRQAAALVAEYDPTRELVLILVDPESLARVLERREAALSSDAGIVLGRREPSPPEAFRRSAS